MKQTFKQVLKHCELPPECPQTVKCKLCGGVLTQVKVNPYFCFWVHKSPEEIKVCKEANYMFHEPVVATSQTWTYNRVTEIWNEKVEKQNVSCAKNKP